MTHSEIFDPSEQSNEEASSIINSGFSTNTATSDENDDWVIER